MAANVEDGSNGTLEDKFEQVVTMETVVAADNKGIDYDKLISKLDEQYKSILECRKYDHGCMLSVRFLDFEIGLGVSSNVYILVSITQL